jgi:hypothetical protein
MSKVNASVVGPEVADLKIPAGDIRVLWGPVGDRGVEPVLRATRVDKVLGVIEAAGAFVVYNPIRVRRRIEQLGGNGTEANTKSQERRSA